MGWKSPPLGIMLCMTLHGIGTPSNGRWPKRALGAAPKRDRSTAYLRRKGTVIGRHRVRRLMTKMGREAIYKRPRTSQPNPQLPVYPYLLRKMQIDRPNQVPLSSPQAATAGQRVCRYHFCTGAERVLVSGRHYGLGRAQSPELAAVKHDAR